MHTISANASKSKKALLSVFLDLVQRKPYSSITVSEIIDETNVARSTFYENFKNKDELLFSAMANPISILTQNALGNASSEKVESLLEHFWEMRSVGRLLFKGSLQNKLIRKLALDIEKGLPQAEGVNIPISALSLQLSSAQILPLCSWLNGDIPGSVKQIATLIMRISTLK